MTDPGRRVAAQAAGGASKDQILPDKPDQLIKAGRVRFHFGESSVRNSELTIPSPSTHCTLADSPLHHSDVTSLSMSMSGGPFTPAMLTCISDNSAGIQTHPSVFYLMGFCTSNHSLMTFADL
jgi:hypothetical protein